MLFGRVTERKSFKSTKLSYTNAIKYRGFAT